MHFKADAVSSTARFKCVVMATGHWPAFLERKNEKSIFNIFIVVYLFFCFFTRTKISN